MEAGEAEEPPAKAEKEKGVGIVICLCMHAHMKQKYVFHQPLELYSESPRSKNNRKSVILYLDYFFYIKDILEDLWAI